MKDSKSPVGSLPPADPLARAAEDIQGRCGEKVQVYWDDEPSQAGSGLRKLKVIARDLPLVFPIEQDVLVERGQPYENFMQAVAGEVSKIVGGQGAAPPAS